MPFMLLMLFILCLFGDPTGVEYGLFLLDFTCGLAGTPKCCIFGFLVKVADPDLDGGSWVV